MSDDKSKKKTVSGLHTYRFDDNPEERRFAAAWSKNDRDGKLLAWLLYVGDQPGCGPYDPSARDKIVAATVIQWLGSPVGQFFLSELGYANPRARNPRELGYEKK